MYTAEDGSVGDDSDNDDDIDDSAFDRKKTLSRIQTGWKMKIYHLRQDLRKNGEETWFSSLS